MMQSLMLFGLAGLCEIGGGYLVWQWLRAGQSFWLGLTGMLLLGLYGIVATLQPISFGGIFIVMSIGWGWGVDRVVPDRFDRLGALVALTGVGIMLYAPRS